VRDGHVADAESTSAVLLGSRSGDVRIRLAIVVVVVVVVVAVAVAVVVVVVVAAVVVVVVVVVIVVGNGVALLTGGESVSRATFIVAAKALLCSS